MAGSSPALGAVWCPQKRPDGQGLCGQPTPQVSRASEHPASTDQEPQLTLLLPPSPVECGLGEA